MKIYVATKWENRSEANRVLALLRSAGHHITYDWTVWEQESTEQALADLSGVLNADCLIVLAEQDLPYKGTYVELGAALAAGLTIYLVGDGLDACLFSKHPDVQKLSLVQVFADIQQRATLVGRETSLMSA